ncbi:MAG: Uma2 family endonuclease [Chloroflexota bacterium]|nr:Uma2 family endonuclease [Chloroflexota bacterium]MDE2910017.1 Uma2 family endonuclease [Chloroflexota bacterium]
MAVQQRIYDVDAFWRFVCQPENHDGYFELIDGEITRMAPPGWEHGSLAGEIYHYFRLFDPERTLGSPSVDAGFYSADDRSTVLSPDVAFTRIERAPVRSFKKWAPVMPDIAVEVMSPGNTLAEMRRKAAIYLQHGTQLVWIIIPVQQSAEVHRLGADGDIEREVIGPDGSLSGEDALPGFSLNLALLFT